MAKILPAGANVDLNLGKDPMDRLVQTVDLALKVGGAFQQAQERRQVKREQDALGVGSLANELINKASSGAEINHALSLMENIDTSNLSASTQSFYQAAKSSGNSRLSQINEIQSLGNEIATFVTQPLIDGKTFTQLNKEEIVNYYNQTNELDSAFEETMNNLAKIKRFKLLTEGSNNKNMKFTGFGGKQMSASEFIVDVDNYSSSKNVFIQASVYDNELLPEEAIFVMTGDRDSYNQRKNQRDKEFQSFKKDYDVKIKSINSTINQINTDALKNKNNYTELVLNNENKQTFVSSFGQLYPDVPISTDIDEAYEQATQYMTNINLSPEELIKNLNQQKTALEGERLIVSKEAKGWGFRYFEPIDVSMFENANKDGNNNNENLDDGNQISKTTEDSLANQDVEPLNVETTEESKEKQRIRKEWNTYTAEQKNEYNNDFDTFYNKVTAPAGGETIDTNLNESQLKQAKPQFKKWQDKLKNEIAITKKNIKDRTREMNQMTSFNKKSLQIQKNKLSLQIKNLQDSLAKKENLLDTTDINVWFNTIASDMNVEQIKTGKSNAELVQNYFANK